MPREDTDSIIGLTGICAIIAFIGSLFFNYVNSFDKKCIGTFIAIQSDDDDGFSKNSKFIQEIFSYGDGYNYTCAVTRLNSCCSSRTIANMATTTVFGSTRNIYVNKKDSGVCIDDSIRNYYRTVAWSLCGIAISPFGIAILYGLYMLKVKCIESMRNGWEPLSNNSNHIQEETIELSETNP